MDKYSYRLTVDGCTVESSSPYLDQKQELVIRTPQGDDSLARRVCKALKMTFLEGASATGSYIFTALCTPETSCFIWAGGCPL